jgi:hypothetical protein
MLGWKQLGKHSLRQEPDISCGSDAAYLVRQACGQCTNGGSNLRDLLRALRDIARSDAINETPGAAKVSQLGCGQASAVEQYEDVVQLQYIEKKRRNNGKEATIRASHLCTGGV